MVAGAFGVMVNALNTSVANMDASRAVCCRYGESIESKGCLLCVVRLTMVVVVVIITTSRCAYVTFSEGGNQGQNNAAAVRASWGGLPSAFSVG